MVDLKAEEQQALAQQLVISQGGGGDLIGLDGLLTKLTASATSE